MSREATAIWTGGLKDGKGTLSTPSGALQQTPYNFSMRFENAPGTSPEELIAAAHAGCFVMALSGQLGEDGMKPEKLEARAIITLEKTDAGPTVTESHLILHARVPGADKAKFDHAAEKAKSGCPISRLLKTNITLESNLETAVNA